MYTGHTLTVEDEAALAIPVGERSYDPTRGIQWAGRYWLSRDLANKAVRGQRLSLRQLLNPEVLYVFDTNDKFIALAELRDSGEVADQHGLYRDRALREQFVEGIATDRAAEAHASASAAWDDVADGLADAAKDASPT